VATIDVGDILPDFGFTVTSNSTGALTAPTSFAVVLTAPDATTPSVTVVNSSTGVYAVTYVATMAGRYRAVGTAVGNGCDGVSVLEWNVSAVSPSSVIGLEDAKTFLRVFSSDTDDEIRAMLEAVSDVCERFTRKTWRRQTFVETYTVGDDTDVIRLRHSPVVSVTTVVENGVTLTASDYTLDGRQGWLKRGSSLAYVDWQCGFQGTTVTYVAGPAGGVVPPNILQGCRLLAQHMWETQRGGGLPRQAGADGEYDPRLGFYVPNRVRQAWGEPRILVR
jgi:uncharacterized phiE125 gp8 family phage protein